MPDSDMPMSRNDKYLIKEYQKYADGDYLLTDFADRTFVVPYKYTVGAKDGKEAVRLFKAALLDFQKEEEQKYIKAKQVPFKIAVGDDEVVVPIDTPKNMSADEIIKNVADRAEIKYNAVINAHRQLADTHFEKKPADFSAAALERYVYKLVAQGEGLAISPNSEELLKSYRFLCSMGDYVSETFKVSAQKLAHSIGKKIIDGEYNALKKYKPKHWKVGLLAGMLAVSGYHLLNGHKEQEPSIAVATDTIPTYTDFKGKVYSDKFGNLKRISELQPEIMATIIAIEGYTSEAFLEGGKNPTKGSGFTMTINEDGSVTPVKMGDTTTPEEDIENNRRYIEREFLRLLGDGVGRRLSDEEIRAGIGSGYCWGTTAFENSCFFQSIKDNESLEEKSRKISGFRKQPGLLKRGFLISQVLNGSWTAEDLLDLPIYLIKDKGYVHCSIYTLDLHNYLPCQKDKNGHYLKDEKGNDIPILCDDDFCMNFYNDSDKVILNKLINQAKRGNASYKTVRQLMNGDMVDAIENKDDRIKFDFDHEDFFAELLKQQKNTGRG